MFPNSPVAVFTVGNLDDLPPEFYSGETFTRQVSGSLNVNGGDFPLTFDLEIRNDGDMLNILARTVFTWDQLGIRVPNISNIVSVEDEVSVQLLLVAVPS
jgi:polyisoprenoid-binding protein YceI